MAWPMLEGRISLLQRSLEQARDFSKKPDLTHVPLEPHVWTATWNDIYRRSMVELSDLQNLATQLNHEDLDLGEAWQRYSKIQQESEDAFLECLDLLGGLALRDIRVDDQTCHLADELIKECASTIGGVPTIVVPSHSGALSTELSTTLRRIAHVRFPEWDIWTLPLVAYEYGHVAIAEGDFDDFVTHQAQAWRNANQDGEIIDIDAVKQRVRVLLSDAFATYSTGPAYACALVLLRLDVVPSSPTGCELARQRAEMVRGLLGALDSQPSRYLAIHHALSESWTLAVDSLPAVPHDTDREPLHSLNLDPADILAKLRNSFQPIVPYTAKDWATAMEWSDRWLDELHNDQEPKLPEDLSAKHRMRDALNAGWLVRIRDPGMTNRVTEVTRDLCRTIIENRSGGKGDARRLPRSPRPGRPQGR